MIFPLNRRSTLSGGIGLAALGTLPALETGCTAITIEKLDLTDDSSRMRAKVKMTGTLEDNKTIHRVSRGWVYGYNPDEDKFTPFFGMLNYNVTRWKRLGDLEHEYTMHECAVFTPFDELSALKTMVNPFTQEVVKPLNYVIGPIEVNVAPEGSVTGPEATIKPLQMDWTVMGGSVWMPVQSEFTFPNPISPEKWPKESSGPFTTWQSFILFMASLDDIENADLASVRALNHYQENVTWAPWLEMSGRPGFCLSRGFGMKLLDFSEIPPDSLQLLQSEFPEMFDLDNWKGVRNPDRDFMMQRKPKPV